MISKKKKYKQEWFYILIIVPSLLVYCVFFLFPIISSSFYSFFKLPYPGAPMDFVGFANFKELFTNTPVFWIALKNNVIYSFFVLVFQTLISFTLAYVISKNIRGKGFFKTYFFMPVVMSSVAISFTWDFMYDPNIGILNKLLETLGLGALAQNWLGNGDIALYSVAIVQIWQWVGFEMIIFLAAMNNIPKEMFEVSKIEGASRWQELRHVILPSIAPATTIAVVLTTIGCFKVFDMIYIMTDGGPSQSTEVLAKLTYDYAFKYQRMGFASAISVILLIVIAFIGFGQLIYLRKKEMNN
ncbi:ABC transporter permease [Vallitalea longa]|uniref:ABC transporter permease n=1 Tax=Vallitalea longa TaxID=2936439 RepID=A0A9W6DDK1_9FIRM|nr:sugar ABC transporter permease [Vallitalea longa]GKX28305.1 ABC transporter permease [Vallitalea longa]